MLDINQKKKKEIILTCTYRNLFVKQNKNQNLKVAQVLCMVIVHLCQLTKTTI